MWENTDQKKLRILTLFTQWTVYSSEHLIAYIPWTPKKVTEAMLSPCKLSFSLRWKKLLVPTFSHFQCSDAGDQIDLALGALAEAYLEPS